MEWLYLLAAGLFEVIGVIGINQVVKKKSIQSFGILFGGFAASFTLLGIAMNTLPMGLSYAVWTGIGTAGGTLVGMIFYGEPRDWKRIFFICIIITAVIGLRLSS